MAGGVARHTSASVRPAGRLGESGRAGPGYPVDRAADEDGWWDAAYSDASLITRLYGGTGDVTTGEGLASSSCSAPGVVVTFLEELRLEETRGSSRRVRVGPSPCRSRPVMGTAGWRGSM
ncbi:hypothetical protein [Actinomadura sp. DC4]|uniref:hypothetical protein n=1 Tax=Actinomadura sp. DC4 TaxID=3055069 RepID=UPI0025B0CF31|nr:hypothetical protein [Actinomadura sp. DC4]MDN3353047.1 hypothetical protein [Actinomadura sp. DC4]